MVKYLPLIKPYTILEHNQKGQPSPLQGITLQISQSASISLGRKEFLEGLNCSTLLRMQPVTQMAGTMQEQQQPTSLLCPELLLVG